MIKQILFLLAPVFFSGLIVAQPTFTMTSTGSCYQAGANTLSIAVNTNSGVASYSWSASSSGCNDTITTTVATGTAAGIKFKCCGTHTIFCTGYNSSNVAVWTVMANTVVLNCPPVLTITQPGPICQGTSTTITASGANTYTWLPSSSSGAVINVSPSSSTCYTLAGSNGICTSYSTVCVTVMPSPTLNISSSNANICGPGTVTLSATGAISYSWSVGATTASVVVNPSSSTCYSVVGINSSGCMGMASKCVTVNPLPAVAVNQPPAACPGISTILTASGAVSYTWQPGNLVSSMLFLFPQTSTCYTVIGYNGTCQASAAVCLTVIPGPTLNILGNSSGTVCKGSSVTLTVTGANTYSWTNPVSNASTVNVIPTSPTAYYVSGTNTNGCTQSFSTAIVPDSTCAHVWPGDANSDGVVNTSDVLELGIYAGATGPVRSGATINYTSQYAGAWTGSGSNSQNKVHIDCNGNGAVNAGDTLAILNNFSLTHTFKKSSGTSQAGDITLVPSGSYFNGTWASVDVMLGSSSNNMSNIYGVAFDLSFDNAMVDNNQVYVKYTSSFLNAGNQNIPFRRIATGSGLANCATVRVDHNNVSGNGKIAELWFKLAPGVTGAMNFSANNVIKVNAAGIKNALAGSTASVNVTAMQVGLGEQNSADAFTFYPNPANTQLFVLSTISENVSYTICDITGRSVLSGIYQNSSSIDITSLKNGLYIIRFSAGDLNSSRRLLIQN
jgi:hypothetical protein